MTFDGRRCYCSALDTAVAVIFSSSHERFLEELELLKIKENLIQEQNSLTDIVNCVNQLGDLVGRVTNKTELAVFLLMVVRGMEVGTVDIWSNSLTIEDRLTALRLEKT